MKKSLSPKIFKKASLTSLFWYKFGFMLTLCIFLFFFIYLSFIKRTKGFSLNKIISQYEYSHRWDTGPLTLQQKELIKKVARQPFFYLGSGKECYAFVSEDGEHVLKFFKQKHMKTKSFLSLAPFPLPPRLKCIREEKAARRAHLRSKSFSSYLTAFQRFPERTGILYLHLNPTSNLKSRVHLVSQRGVKHVVDLDKMEFLIQRKAEKALNYFDNLLKENKIKEAKQAIGSILDLIITRDKNGISDQDNNCERNIGFVDGRAAFIDVGEFRPMPASYPSQEEFEQATKDLHEWLAKRSPELVSFLEVQIQKRIRS